MVIVYSYLRYSDIAQKAGDSKRRQEAAFDVFMQRHKSEGVVLNTTLKMKDEGVPSFKKQNLSDRRCLGQFLKEIERGMVPHGSYLVVENLDRLSRAEVWDGLDLIKQIVMAGIRIVQLVPSEMIVEKGSPPHVLMMVVMELSRGHGESKMKSERNGSAMKEKRAAAREHRTPHGRRMPLWMELTGVRKVPGQTKLDFSEAEYILKDDVSEDVRRMFEMCAGGAGTKTIARTLGDRWNHRTVHNILRSEEAIGRFRFKGEGEPIEGYFPPVVDEELYYRAQAQMSKRRLNSGGPCRRTFNPLQGLLWDAVEDCPMRMVSRNGRRWYVNARANAGKAKWRVFPLEPLVDALLSQLGKVRPSDLNLDSGADEAAKLTAQLEDIDAKLKDAEQHILNDPRSVVWPRIVTELEKKRRPVADRLIETNRKAANPLAASWADVRARVEPRQLNAALRNVLVRIYAVTVTRPHDRLCCAQVRFANSDLVRSYYIRWVPSKGGIYTRKESWTARMSTEADSLDFREKADAEVLYSLLAE